MCQEQEDDRLYPHKLGHIKHQQEVYHMADVTDILYQCIPEWKDDCTTGGMFVPKEYRRHPWDTRGTPFGFAIVVAICGRGRTRWWNAGMGRTRGARRVWGTSGTHIYHMGHP